MTVRRLAVLALAAGVLLTIGALLDWSGVVYSSRLDRGLALAAGGLTIAAAVLAAVWRPRVLLLAIASGVLGLNMAIVNIKDISGHDFEYAEYPEASVGVGLYLVLAGGALALAVGLSALCCRGDTSAPRKQTRADQRRPRVHPLAEPTWSAQTRSKGRERRAEEVELD